MIDLWIDRRTFGGEGAVEWCRNRKKLLVPPQRSCAHTHTRINDQQNVKWLFSFLSADKKKTYCLYEAPDAEAVRGAAKLANLPADVVVEVSDLNPAMFA